MSQTKVCTNELEIKYGESCNICFKQCSRHPILSYDHNHETGKFRGFLCDRCNTAIGKFEDSIELLESAIKYLSRGETNGEQSRNI